MASNGPSSQGRHRTMRGSTLPRRARAERCSSSSSRPKPLPENREAVRGIEVPGGSPESEDEVLAGARLEAAEVARVEMHVSVVTHEEDLPRSDRNRLVSLRLDRRGEHIIGPC